MIINTSFLFYHLTFYIYFYDLKAQFFIVYKTYDLNLISFNLQRLLCNNIM